ncbi:MAG: EAL domain-containing response regulator [Chromatiales bacterium]|nr:EAL domain-containing response regulator [Chromatiales bacterium]
MNILLVDDEPFVLKLLVRQLNNLGFERVVACDSAEAALTRLRSADAPVDMVFSDLQMPQMDGVEFVRHLVQMGYHGALVLISGEDRRILQTAERLARAHRLRVVGTLTKPVSPAQLQQVLEAGREVVAPADRVQGRSYEAAELARAIADGELENYFQPKVNPASGEVAGVEVLVRWHHPRDGLVMPVQFIPMAEEQGLIDGLTQVVLVDALHQARQWQDDGMPLHIAVNVSMDSLAALEFADFVADEVARAGLPMNHLVLEVTESRLMKDPLASLDILARLRLKRIGLSIDDFGTGHSSLAQLRDIPFSELKVDYGFVHGAWRDASLQAIFEASLGVARQLGMKTVAEGVEDRDDWDFLRARGCDLAQGFFIGRPMPAAELPEWMAQWEARRRDLDLPPT